MFDLLSLAVSLALVECFVTPVPFAAAVCALVTAALIPLAGAGPDPGALGQFVAALPRRLITLAMTAALVHYFLKAPFSGLWFGAVWPVLGWLLALKWRQILTAQPTRVSSPSVRVWTPDRAGTNAANRRWTPFLDELLRSSLLVFAALWLMRGYRAPTLRGTNDALWYAMNLADMLAQVHAGVFPVWIGQSVYQFNGAMCPLRVAPGFHYLGALLDAATFRTLGVFALQNLLLTLLAIFAIISTYAGLRALLPTRKWLAAGLASLFLSCPGVLGLSYNSDLFNTWTTLPLVPLAWFATVRSFQDNGSRGTLILLGLALGACWWGHSPIALWSTFLAGCAQAVRIGLNWRQGFRWGNAFLGAAAFLAVAAYPVGSVFLYPPEIGVRAETFQHASVAVIVYFMHKVCPAVFLPISATGRSLGDLQLGYGLWALLVFLACAHRAFRRPASGVPLAAALFLTLLLLPVPGMDVGLWTLVPALVRDVTGNWVMDRLYLPLAAAIVFGTAACASVDALNTGIRRYLLPVLVGAGCIWSFAEAEKFVAGSRLTMELADSPLDLLRPENIQITRYSYAMFSTVPEYFTDGVTDPQLETRIFAGDSGALLCSNIDSILEKGSSIAASNFTWGPDATWNHAELDSAIHLEPGRSYVLQLRFSRPESINGVLVIKGDHLFREYNLPDYGGTKSFGAGGGHASALPLETSGKRESISISFYPSTQAMDGSPRPPVGSAQLIEYDPSILPVHVEGWIPFRARVQSSAPGWLETPRMFQPGYVASVARRPAAVRKSPEGLVSIEVPQGTSEVELSYQAPNGLRFLFWLSTLSFTGLVSAGALRMILHLLGSHYPAKTSDAAPSA